MMKLISAILSFFYLTLTSGAVLSVHYCGGQLKSVDLMANNEICCCGFDNGSSGCCEDEMIQLEIDVDQNLVQNYYSALKLYYKSFLLKENNTVIETKYDYIITNDVLIPPPKVAPLWLLNCTLTYYG